MEERVKAGTYTAELTAADWSNILLALGGLHDTYVRFGLTGAEESVYRTLERLRPQVMDTEIKTFVVKVANDFIPPITHTEIEVEARTVEEARHLAGGGLLTTNIWEKEA